MRPVEITIECILTILNSLAPFSLAEDWDNVGLLLGAPDQKVTGILIGLDPTAQLLDEAITRGANLVITHHPIIFSALKSIRIDQPTGAFINKALTKGISVIACHTNLDVVPTGVSRILAQRLGLTALATLSATTAGDSDIGFGQIGTLPLPLNSHEFLEHLCKALSLPALSMAGHLPETIQRVAVCGGSGSDFATMAQAQGAQLYITGEVKHHVARWAEEVNFCIIDAGHFATEHLISAALAAELAATLASQSFEIPVYATEKQINPFSFFIAGNDQQPSNERYGH
jgi:dinuclear metal center YbgI/SA1388 family protein